jgi:hypothetical protein
MIHLRFEGYTLTIDILEELLKKNQFKKLKFEKISTDFYWDISDFISNIIIAFDSKESNFTETNIIF